MTRTWLRRAPSAIPVMAQAEQTRGQERDEGRPNRVMRHTASVTQASPVPPFQTVTPTHTRRVPAFR